FSSRRRHTRSKRDWSSDVCSSDLMATVFIWHMIFLPLLLLLAIALSPILAMAALIRIARRLRNSNPASVDANVALSRRQFLGVRSEERRVGKERGVLSLPESFYTI